MSTLDLDPQDPDEILDHVINWQPQLVGGATITVSSWPDFPTPQLSLEIETFDATSTRARISVGSGVVGDEYTFTNRITTSDGEVIDQRCRLRIRPA